jgi:S-formylglutathione hydrolase FrmB
VRRVAAVGLLAACFHAPVPMHSLTYALKPDAKCLVVLLPGIEDHMQVFDEVGQLKVLRDSGLSLDVVAADASLGYYLNEQFLERLHDDVVTQAKDRRHYEKTWIIGPSIGGFGTLFYAQHHPEQIDGVIAFAPYLGDEPLIKELHDSGGLKHWAAPAIEPVSEENYQRQLWRWLQEVTQGKTKGPDIYVGWGLSDRLGPTDALLGEALPAHHALTADGGHGWAPWNVMLARILKEGSIAQQCAP